MSCISDSQHTLLPTLMHFIGHLHKVTTSHDSWVFDRHKIKHIFKRDNSGYFFWSESKQWIPVINSVRTTMPLFVVYTFSMYRNKNKYQRIQFFLVYYEGQKEFLTLYHSAVSVSNWHTWILLNTYSIHTGI